MLDVAASLSKNVDELKTREDKNRVDFVIAIKNTLIKSLQESGDVVSTHTIIRDLQSDPLFVASGNSRVLSTITDGRRGCERNL